MVPYSEDEEAEEVENSDADLDGTDAAGVGTDIANATDDAPDEEE